MTATLDDVTKKKPVGQSAEQQAATELVRLAREQGLSLTGPDGLLKQLTKTVLERALTEEMTEHLGHEKHDPPGAGRAASSRVQPLSGSHSPPSPRMAGGPRPYGSATLGSRPWPAPYAPPHSPSPASPTRACTP